MRDGSREWSKLQAVVGVADTIRPACLSVLIPFVSPTSGGRMPNEEEEVCASLEYSKVTDIRREVTDRRGKRRRLTPPPPPRRGGGEEE